MNEKEVLTKHHPVLLQEVLTWIILTNPAIANSSVKDQSRLILDSTVGGGGHSLAMLNANENLRIYGIDQDAIAVSRVQKKLSYYSDRFFAIHGNFAEFPKLLKVIDPNYTDQKTFAGILVDLGISSDQLNDPQRGFAFSQEGPLDMRMNLEKGLTAGDLLNQSSVGDLIRIFKTGGVGSISKDLAYEIERKRPLQSTKELALLCKEVGLRSIRSKKYRSRKFGPEVESIGYWAVVPFQAIRIAVNEELGVIQKFLDNVLDYLSPQGRLAIISFHSIEDQLVTNRMREWSREAPAPVRLPTLNQPTAKGFLLTKSAILPTAEEIAINPRARSARLRVFEKTVERN